MMRFHLTTYKQLSISCLFWLLVGTLETQVGQWKCWHFIWMWIEWVMRHFLLSLKPTWTNFTVDSARERMKLSCIKNMLWKSWSTVVLSLQHCNGCLSAPTLVPAGINPSTAIEVSLWFWVCKLTFYCFLKPVLLSGLPFYLLRTDASSGTWNAKNHPSPR